jgi:hypothetical protein
MPSLAEMLSALIAPGGVEQRLPTMPPQPNRVARSVAMDNRIAEGAAMPPDPRMQGWSQPQAPQGMMQNMPWQMPPNMPPADQMMQRGPYQQPSQPLDVGGLMRLLGGQ